MDEAHAHDRGSMGSVRQAGLKSAGAGLPMLLLHISMNLQGFQGLSGFLCPNPITKVRAGRQKELVMLAEERMGKLSVSKSIDGDDGRVDGAMGASAQASDVGAAWQNGG